MELIIISGGQTGVERAALDVALEFGLECAGWCPRGCLADDGPLDPRYALTETNSEDHDERTLWNVRDSDATLVVHPAELMGGTTGTESACRRMEKPLLIVSPDDSKAAAKAAHWIASHDVKVLNVDGPREGLQPGSYSKATELLREVLSELSDSISGGGTEF